MRRLLRYCLISISLIIGIAGCETEPILFRGPYFVSFTESTGVSKESFSKPIQIEVHMAGAAPDQDVGISYSVSGSAREGIDYRILGTRGTVIIEKGKYFGYIELQLINNSNNILRSQDVVFTLLSTDEGSIQIGQGTAGIGKTFTYTILDDCVLGGTYIGKSGAFSIPVKDIQITSQDCETYLLSNWNIDVFSFDDPLDLFFIDNFDNTLTIPEQEEEDFPEEFATIRGTGVVNPLTREIIMTVTLVDFEDQPQITFTLIPD